LERRFNFEGPRIEGIAVIIIALLIIAGGVLFFSIGRITVGYVAVIVDPVFGSTNVVGTGQNAQYFIKAPWASVFKIYIATDSIHMWSDATGQGDFPAVESLTKDGLKVEVDITVRWSIDPLYAGELYRRYPRLDWKDRAIIPIIRETMRNLLVDYTSIETIELREAIGTILEQQMISAFNNETSLQQAIVLDAVNIRRISLPTTFVEAIEAKLAAEQLSIAAEFNKTRQLVLADANAQSAIIEATGQAQGRIILANSTRDAVTIIASTNPEPDSTDITKLYLYLETLRDIAESGKGQFVVVPDESQYILSIP
jgi:regulator of protease activity HflC (stomatin/prohibitin superfamily)